MAGQIMASVLTVGEALRHNRQPLRAPSARAQTAAAGQAETSAWCATAADIYAAKIGLRDRGRAGIGIGIRGVTASDVGGRGTEAPSAFRFATTAILITGGGIGPISSP